MVSEFSIIRSFSILAGIRSSTKKEKGEKLRD
jgi:hypothetical protein